ncbi:MAG TPA: tetratricopeptide repeat protein [Pyrinomonadaceae bacterium]|nr:tetratricopeptide repeat protein [Pyrinomonadaceae bacterium]
MARTSKKRARELKHDKFRDATLSAFDRLGDRMEGRGRTLLYVIGAIVALAILAGVWSWWRGGRDAEARAALGRAIQVSEAQVTATPASGSTEQTFPSERERAQAALKEFEAVAAKYGDPYDDIARFMAAAQLLTVERARGLSELEALSKSGNEEVAARASFALAQAREADGQHDAAVALYNSLLKDNRSSVPADSVKLRLASVYEKQGKKEEAVNLLFDMVKAAREAKDKDGKPAPQSAAASDAADMLKRLDAARYEQLPPEAPAGGGLPF